MAARRLRDAAFHVDSWLRTSWSSLSWQPSSVSMSTISCRSSSATSTSLAFKAPDPDSSLCSYSSSSYSSSSSSSPGADSAAAAAVGAFGGTPFMNCPYAEDPLPGSSPSDDSDVSCDSSSSSSRSSAPNSASRFLDTGLAGLKLSEVLKPSEVAYGVVSDGVSAVRSASCWWSIRLSNSGPPPRSAVLAVHVRDVLSEPRALAKSLSS
mmetsp:Transcript_1464/g.4317  ORF Transcript_1464/g.4317 Transcript_1464/m.4317 type:complete len:209 (-) Transcript_1464:307-933(-)